MSAPAATYAEVYDAIRGIVERHGVIACSDLPGNRFSDVIAEIVGDALLDQFSLTRKESGLRGRPVGSVARAKHHLSRSFQYAMKIDSEQWMLETGLVIQQSELGDPDLWSVLVILTEADA